MEDEKIKLIAEDVKNEVMSLLKESTVPENIHKDICQKIMEYKQLSIERGRCPKVFPKDINRAEFQLHYDAWRRKTQFLSNHHKIIQNPDFFAIVDMGKRAVPFIYEIISKRVDWIALAVPDIVGHVIGNPSYSLKEICDEIKQYIEETGMV